MNTTNLNINLSLRLLSILRQGTGIFNFERGIVV